MGRCLDRWVFLGATWMCWKRVCWDSVDLFTVYKIVYVSIYLSIYRIYLPYLIYLSNLSLKTAIHARTSAGECHLYQRRPVETPWKPWDPVGRAVAIGRLAAGSSDPFPMSQGSNCSTSTWARLQYHVDSRVVELCIGYIFEPIGVEESGIMADDWWLPLIVAVRDEVFLKSIWNLSLSTIYWSVNDTCFSVRCKLVGLWEFGRGLDLPRTDSFFCEQFLDSLWMLVFGTSVQIFLLISSALKKTRGMWKFVGWCALRQFELGSGKAYKYHFRFYGK